MRPGRLPPEDPREQAARAQLATKTTATPPVTQPQPSKPKKGWSYGDAK